MGSGGPSYMNKLKKPLTLFITAISLILLSVLAVALIKEEILPVPFILIWCLTTPAIVICLAYSIYYLIEWKTNKKVKIIAPLTCLVVAIVSGVIGIISNANDHSIVMRGMEAQLIWFLITVPSLVAMIVCFIRSYIQTKNELEKLKEQQE